MSLVDLSGVEESSGFQPLAPGRYLLNCADAEVKSTKDGTGQFISCQFEVVSPKEHEGRKVFGNFNIQNKSEQAQEIGLSQLKTFMKCAGVEDNSKLESVNELMGLTAMAQLKVRKSEEYGDSNEIHYWVDPSEGDDGKQQSFDTKEKLPF